MAEYRLWGGQRLADLLSEPMPNGPVGEAWMLSDRDDHASIVDNGTVKGQTLGQLMVEFPERMLGKLAGHFQRFPLLLKFLDKREMLSVQVHPGYPPIDLCHRARRRRRRRGRPPALSAF
jgi:mannose-6-phosphate isomerase